MSTTVIVKANHGWPVEVTPLAINAAYVPPKGRVAAGETREFCVHSGQDLLIHEVQPSELAAEAATLVEVAA